MSRRCSGLLLMAVSGLLAGCENTVANPAERQVESPSRLALAPGVAPTPPAPVFPPGTPSQTTSRTGSRDDDADGIDDYRAVITETFDSTGNLVARTKTQDFDANGIVDSQVTTTFDAPSHP